MTDDLLPRLEALLAFIQRDNRPLPWVVHTGCSYRRIASVPTRGNEYRSFPDGNVLHALKQNDGHPDLSMGEQEMVALVELVNALPTILAALRPKPRAGRCGHHFDANCDGCTKASDYNNRELDNLRAALAASHIPDTEVAWQPIETCPMDGTPVIIIDAGCEEPAAFVAHFATHRAWNENEPAWLVGSRWCRTRRLTPALERAYAELVGIICEPTHWMPLPAPPADQIERGAFKGAG